MHCNISGTLLKIINDTKANTDGMLTPEGCKMFKYAGHKSTISNHLSAIKVWNPQIPDNGIKTERNAPKQNRSTWHQGNRTDHYYTYYYTPAIH
jgi:hypothetical protein